MQWLMRPRTEQIFCQSVRAYFLGIYGENRNGLGAKVWDSELYLRSNLSFGTEQQARNAPPPGPLARPRLSRPTLANRPVLAPLPFNPQTNSEALGSSRSLGLKPTEIRWEQLQNFRRK
jgi:hypothetical protein